MASYMLNIRMDDTTVIELGNRGMHLFAFKAVKGAQGLGGQPLVWFRTDRYSLTTEIGWETALEAYDSLDDIVPGGQIHASASYPATLGDIFTITGEHGTGEVSQGGEPGVITIESDVATQFSCGISQQNDAGFAPICAFPINKGFANFFTPIEKVLVLFASDPVNTGTVVIKSRSPGLLVDMTGAESNTREVTFNIVAGWDCGGATWCKHVDAATDLTKLLIEGSAALELARLASIATRAARLAAY